MKALVQYLVTFEIDSDEKAINFAEGKLLVPATAYAASVAGTSIFINMHDNIINALNEVLFEAKADGCYEGEIRVQSVDRIQTITAADDEPELS